MTSAIKFVPQLLVARVTAVNTASFMKKTRASRIRSIMSSAVSTGLVGPGESGLRVCLLQSVHGSDIASIEPGTGAVIRLFHPRRDVWTDHFRLNRALIEASTEVGAATVRVLRLNADERVTERRFLQSLGNYPR